MQEHVETRGRKKGSVSFTLVPLTELNAKLGKHGIVVVSRKFAESLNILGQPVISTLTMIPLAVSHAKQDGIKSQDFDADTDASKKDEDMVKPQVTVDNF